MPTHEEHCQDSLKRYGKRFDDLHRWMDEPWEVLGKEHRMYRHDPYATPREARELFGEYADHACLDHIRLDHPRLAYWQSEERAKQGEYAGTCPKCGSPMVWRIAKLTGELYAGCTNYPTCKYHRRSYQRTPRDLESPKSVEEKRSVNWESVLNELDGKVVSFSGIKKLVNEKYEKKKLYWSEWSGENGVLERYSDKFVFVSKKMRVGNRLKRFWYIRKRAAL